MNADRSGILNCKICRRAFFASSLSHQNQTNASQPGVQRVTRARRIAIFSEINFFVLSVQLTFRRAMSEDAARGGEKYETTIRNFFITCSRSAAHSCSRYFSARILIKIYTIAAHSFSYRNFPSYLIIISEIHIAI